MNIKTLEKANELQKKIGKYKEILENLESREKLYICERFSDTFESRFSSLMRLEDEDLEIVKETVEKMLKNAKEEFEEL